MQIINYTNNGKRIQIPFFAGTGIQDVYVKISKNIIDDLFQGKPELYNLKTLLVSDVKEKKKLFTARSTYEPNDKNPCLFIKISIDTRHFYPPEKIEFINFDLCFKRKKSNDLTNPKVVEIYFCLENHPIHDEIRAGLVVDLGNTRSFAVCIDNLDHKPETYKLDFESYKLKHILDEDEFEQGIFDSFMILKSPIDHNDKINNKLSFVQLGNSSDAIDIQRKLPGLISELGRKGDVTLSSPKRYFWQNDPNISPWYMYQYNDFEETDKIEPLSTLLAKYLEDNKNDNISRSSMLSAFIVELLERAERQLNNPLFFKESGINKLRRITDITITYPAAWSHLERDLYKSVLEKGIYHFCLIRGLPIPKLNVSCDEASAVLLSYVYGEIRKFGNIGENWIEFIGRANNLTAKSLPDARIAVIDIGGGSSDLIIADIKDAIPGAGTRIKIDRLHQDGVNIAGDEFLKQALAQMIIPAIAESICTNPDEIGRIAEAIMELINSPEFKKNKEVTPRQLWFPLAIKFITELLKNLNTNRKLFHLDLSDGKALGGSYKNFENMVNRKLIEMGNGDFFKTSEMTFSFKENKNRLLTVSKTVFEPIARRFGAAVAAFDCDLVLIAGKTIDFQSIREVFLDNIPIPEDKIKLLNDYHIGRGITSLANNRGHISDPKITTVLGASIYTLAEQGALNAFSIETNVAVGINEMNSYWGVVSGHSLRFRNSEAIFSKDKPDNGNIDLIGKEVFIARRRFAWERQDAEIVYELRIKPKYTELGVPEDPIVTLSRYERGNRMIIEIEKVKGRFPNGTQFEKKHLELRHCIMQDNEFWLDSGNILPDNWLQQYYNL
jgi:hypothetical protein